MMAIETTYFSGTSSEANNLEVTTWLTANAAEYFDKIIGGNGYDTGVCKIGDITALEINYRTDIDTPKLFTTRIKNGQSVSGGYRWSNTNRVVRAYKTDNGICLYCDKANSVIITKSTNGSILIAHSFVDKSTDHLYWTIADFNNSTNYLKSNYFQNTFTSADLTAAGVYSAGATALTPACTDAGTYSENLFFVPFTQFAGQSGIAIDVDGTKYVYNGVFALKE